MKQKPMRLVPHGGRHDLNFALSLSDCVKARTSSHSPRAMIHIARLPVSCLVLALGFSALRAAEADAQPAVVIERAPESAPAPSQPDELTALRTENQRLSKELTKAREVLERLQADAVGLASAKAKENASAEENARELAALRDKLAKLQSAPSAAAVDEDAARKVERAQSAARSLAVKKELLESTLAAANARIAELSAAKPADDSKAVAEKLRADEATTRLNTIIAGVDRLTAEKAELETQLGEARRLEAALRQQLAAAQQAPSTPAAAAPEVTARLALAEDKLSTALRSNAALQSEIELLKTASADNPRLNAELQSLRQEKAARDTQAPELTTKIADLEAKLSTTLRSFTLLQAENEQLKKAAGDQAQQAAELDQVRKQNAALEARLASASSTPTPPAPSNETENKLATVLRSYAQLQAEHDQLKKTAEDQAQQHAANLDALRQQNAALEAKIAAVPAAPAPAAASPASSDAENKLSTVLRSYTLLQAENDRLKSEVAQTVQSAQATTAKSASENAAQVSALFDELRQTKASVTALSAENAQLKTRLALAGSPPGTTLSSPSRPGSAAAISAAAPSPAPAPSATPPTERKHTVVLGDTLGKISRQYYGSPNRWEDIMRANSDVVKDSNALVVGTTLRIP